MRTSRNRGSSGRRPQSASDWKLFADSLGVSLANLPHHTIAVLAAKRGWCYVQLEIGPFAVRAEAMSNQYIEPPEYQLSTNDIQVLRELGWQTPDRPPPELHDGAATGHSPNYWQDFLVPVDFGGVARIAADTLRRAYGIAHPSDLTCRAFPQQYGKAGSSSQ